jgi:hypothetical protein
MQQFRWIVGLSAASLVLLPGGLLNTQASWADQYRSTVILSPGASGRRVILDSSTYRPPIGVDPYYSPYGVEVYPRHQTSTIVIDGYGRRNNTVIVQPNSNVRTVIINPGYAPRRQCSTLIMGSPIPSPVPIDQNTGQFC